MIKKLIEPLLHLKSEQSPIAIFDLDSTLFNTSPRNYAILKAFAESHPEAKPFLDQFDPLNMGYNLMDDLIQKGCQSKPLLQSLKSFWMERFFTHQYLLKDIPYEGAQALVQCFVQANYKIIYLSGRDVPNMREGTVQALKKYNFPTHPNMQPLDPIVLWLKPKWDMNDQLFKQRAFEHIRTLGTVRFAIENEPQNANLFAQTFPKALVVLHRTVCADPNYPLLDKVHEVADLRGC